MISRCKIDRFTFRNAKELTKLVMAARTVSNKKTVKSCFRVGMILVAKSSDDLRFTPKFLEVSSITPSGAPRVFILSYQTVSEEGDPSYSSTVVRPGPRKSDEEHAMRKTKDGYTLTLNTGGGALKRSFKYTLFPKSALYSANETYSIDAYY